MPSLNVLSKNAEDIFCSGKVSILPSNTSEHNLEQGDGEAPASSIVQNEASDRLLYSTCAYYRDGTSNRSKVVVPVLISFQNIFDRKNILKSGAIQPMPSEYDEEKEDSSLDVQEGQDGSDEYSEEGNVWDAELDLIGETQDEKKDIGSYELTFQCTTCTSVTEQEKNNSDVSAQGSKAVVESVKILSTSLVNNDSCENGIRFDVEIAIQSTPQSGSSFNEEKEGRKESDLENMLETDLSKIQLEIRSVLVHSPVGQNEDMMEYSLRSMERSIESADPNPSKADDISLALQALNMGLEYENPYASIDGMKTSSYFSDALTYFLPPTSKPAPRLDLTIMPALVISVREVNAPQSNTGITLVSLIMYHSNLHNENVNVTSIALHPGHSRLAHDMTYRIDDGNANANGKAMQGGENAVINMTKNVRWGYASGTAPSLPLLLKPQEAFATVIQINANEVMMERAFLSPICVRAAVGDKIENADVNIATSAHAVADTFRDKNGRNTSMVMVSTDARWTTSPVAVGLTDAFRVTVSVQDTICSVGAQVVVHLKVANLSSDPRDLMLIMAKDDEEEDVGVSGDKNINGMGLAGGDPRSMASSLGMSSASAKNTVSSSQTDRVNSVNNAVVYEVSGYTFGCWGLSGNDNGTVPYTRDRHLLAVDAALLLGEVKGQLSVEAELRFVPLREGTLSIPNFKLYDKIQAKWYDCFHTLKIISTAKQ